MLKLCVLATILVAVVICAPLDQPHVRVKRSGGEDEVVETGEKRSNVGYKPADVKEAEGDQSASVQTEIAPAEDTSTEPDVISNPKQETLEGPDTQNDDPKSDVTVKDDVTSTNDVTEESDGSHEDLTESEEEDLQKLMSSETTQNDIQSAESDDTSDEDEKSSEITASSPPKGRYSKLLYDLYSPYAYGRRRRAAGQPAATAEDMMMGGGGAVDMGGIGGAKIQPGGTRRIKRDLKMDELRTLLKRGGQYMDEYADGYDYPDYPSYGDNPEYQYDYEQERLPLPDYEQLAEQLAEDEARHEYPDEYPEYPKYESDDMEEYYDEPSPMFPAEYPGDQGGYLAEDEAYFPEETEGYYPGESEGYYPGEPDLDELTAQQKLALMTYLEQQELEKQAYEEYPGGYPDVEETYEDLGPAANQVYKRQYLSFVPGSKRSIGGGQFYPTEDGWWRGITDPLAEQKRNNREYERLMRLAEMLNGPYPEEEEWRKK